jgi:hypothetical protein
MKWGDGLRMIKDNIRDYATEAFRFYARMGYPDPEQIKEQIRKEAYEKGCREYIGAGGISKPTEAAILRAESELENRMAELKDLIAVHKTLERLNGVHNEIIYAIEYVYFEQPDKDLEKSDIETRVIKACVEIPASRRTVYYWLKKARRMFAEERGLRR